MSFSARTILNRVARAFSMNGIPLTSTWGVQTLTISKVMVSCTPYIDLGRLYRTQYALTAFSNSPQGVVLTRGGMKMFSRCGPSLSHGAPADFSLIFEGVTGTTNGYVDTDGTRVLRVDVTPPTLFSRGDRNNDYFTQTDGFVFGETVSLNMPDPLNDNDLGGNMTLHIRPRPIMNMPFSGELLDNPLTGGVQLKNSAITDGALTTTNLASYSAGWFNNLNPFSPDYDINYNNPNSAALTRDNYPYFDYKMVDIMRRKIEVWICLLAPIVVYTGNPIGV